MAAASACCFCSQHLLQHHQSPWLCVSVLLLLSTPVATQSNSMAAHQRAASALNTCCDSITLHGCRISVLLPPARPAAMRSKSVAAVSACYFCFQHLLRLNQTPWLLRQRAASTCTTCCNAIKISGCHVSVLPNKSACCQINQRTAK
jgi:hypothetical protein